MSKLKISKNVTIGKIVLSLIAIGVLFVPVYAVQTIEARAITHALELEGLYINGTALEIIDFDNDTREQIEDYFSSEVVNDSVGADSVAMIHNSTINLLYRDKAVYIGSGNYSMSYNISEESGTIQMRKIYIPLNINGTDLLEPDFIRIMSDWDLPPAFWLSDGVDSLELAPFNEVATDNYIFINTIQTRSNIANFENSQVFLYYNMYEEPETSSWTVKIQTEFYEGADVFTWNDDTLYIVSILLCDVLLIGAIVFASDPIDIKIDRPGYNKRR